MFCEQSRKFNFLTIKKWNQFRNITIYPLQQLRIIFKCTENHPNNLWTFVSKSKQYQQDLNIIYSLKLILFWFYLILFIKIWYFGEYVSKYLFSSEHFSYIATVLSDNEQNIHGQNQLSRNGWTESDEQMNKINLNWTPICIWILFLRLNDWYGSLTHIF